MKEAYMANLNVLIIEDLPRWQSLFKSLLKKINKNVNVNSAYNQAEAESYFENNTYDLIILDLKIPLNNLDKNFGTSINLDLLNKIRKSYRNKLCGIIITSAYGEISIVKDSLRLNKVYNFFEKGDTFDNSLFTQNLKEAIFQSRLWQIEEIVNNRYQLTIHLNKDSIIGCEVVHGTNISASHMLDRPKNFNCDEFARRGDNLNIFLSTSEGLQRWRPEAKAIGKEIYEQLFSERAFLENLYKAQSNTKSTNDLWIRLNGSANTLGVPFELMHNNLDYLSHQHIFTRSLTGYNIPHKKTFHLFLKDLEKSNETLRILIAGSNCDGLIPQVDAEIEILKAEITDSLNNLGINFKVEPLLTEEASYEKVSEALRSGNYHIFHFCGHGDFVNQMPENSGIWLLDKTGMPKKLGAAQLNLLTQNSNLQFIFLNCCLSAGTADRIGSGDFYGVFEALVRAGVPSALGYRWTVLDKSALQLARKFYQKLWRSFSPGESLYYARQEIKFEQGLNDETWASPVLLMQNS
jgi:CheY-like chemotaxis protein